MQYISTRGDAPTLGFSDALLTGLAHDGGLYLPAQWPQFSRKDIRALRGKGYQEIAFTVLFPFVENDIPAEDFRSMIEDAYKSFRHPAIVPLVQSGANSFIMELFHGPTLAFKDVAMQLLARLMDYALERNGQRATIVGATSGDTGGAAIEAFAGRQNSDLFILFPHNRVSPVQQRQMTTSGAANVKAMAIEGNFDDCQNLVKAMFNHKAFRNQVNLSGVNSINWARIMAQIVYYFTSALSLGAPERKVSFTVPTGNFGDIFAGYCARKMGLPIAKLVIATNDNDILARALRTGRYETRDVMPTSSPSMDIQISSNFERLLFEASDRDPAIVRECMSNLVQSGNFTIGPSALKSIKRDFSAARTTQKQAAATIRETLAESGYLLDPHTATAFHVARRFEKSRSPMITLATAHPAKFPAAVNSACGIDPALPSWLSDLMHREETFDVLQPDLDRVETYIARNASAAQE